MKAFNHIYLNLLILIYAFTEKTGENSKNANLYPTCRNNKAVNIKANILKDALIISMALKIILRDICAVCGVVRGMWSTWKDDKNTAI